MTLPLKPRSDRTVAYGTRISRMNTDSIAGIASSQD
jgi:hypothetical protein